MSNLFCIYVSSFVSLCLKNTSFCLKSFVFLSYFRNFVSRKTQEREKEKRRNGVIAALLLEA